MLISFLLSALAALLVFVNTLPNPFLYDDVFYVEKNPQIRDLRMLPKAFLSPFSPYAPGLYRPFTAVSYAVDFALYGLDPRGFHLTNILLHAVVSGFVFLLTSRFLSLLPSLAAALIFATHPVHTEAVAWVSGRSELLAGLLTLLSALSFLPVRAQKENRRAASLLIMSALFWFLALLSKESALPLLLVLLVLPFVSLKGENFPSIPLEGANFQYVNILKVRFGRVLLPFGLVFALYLLLRVQALGGLTVPLEHVRTAGLSFMERLALMTPVLAHYLRLLVFPVGLRIEYDWVSFSPMTTTLSALLLLSVIAMWVWFFRMRFWIANLAFLWFFLFLLPVMNLLPIGEVVAERFLYLPSVGFALLIGALGERLQQRWPRTCLPTFVALLVVFSFLTIQRNAEWRDPERFWRGTLEHSPHAPHALQNLAALLFAEGELQESQVLIERALERSPGEPMLHFLAGQIALSRGEGELARQEFEVALRLARPRELEFTDFQRGSALLYLQRYEEALEHFERALPGNPSDPSLWNNLGITQAHLGKLREAEASFQRALMLHEEQRWQSAEDARNEEGVRENLEMLKRMR
jgi:Tfp pilus assembly protein PilF